MMKMLFASLFIIVLVSGEAKNKTTQMENETIEINGKPELATFGSGCFWCSEAVFEEVKGVMEVVSGYAGGGISKPTYKEVCSGLTGHAEVIQITFDPAQISFKNLLEIFFKTHDPTSLNRQGADVGIQYRSVVFYHNEDQKETTEETIAALDRSGAWNKAIVTEVSLVPEFFKAEAHHQNYYEKNPYEGYCQFMIGPKLEKFRKVFKDYRK
jgi:peptide-methionine (S)-S-oxide reductase